MVKIDFFTEYGEANRYQNLEVIGKGSYGLVCSATDTQTGEKVAIKKINDVFDHVSDAIRILREIKILRFLQHPDIVQIKHILLPPSVRDFKDIYVVFELMETDLHQVVHLTVPRTIKNCLLFVLDPKFESCSSSSDSIIEKSGSYTIQLTALAEVHAECVGNQG